jgi:hypothetical protein
VSEDIGGLGLAGLTLGCGQEFGDVGFPPAESADDGAKFLHVMAADGRDTCNWREKFVVSSRVYRRRALLIHAEISASEGPAEPPPRGLRWSFSICAVGLAPDGGAGLSAPSAFNPGRRSPLYLSKHFPVPRYLLALEIGPFPVELRDLVWIEPDPAAMTRSPPAARSTDRSGHGALSGAPAS